MATGLAGMNVQAALDAVNALDAEQIAALPLDDAVAAWQQLNEAHKVLNGLREDVGDLIARAMPDKKMTLAGQVIEWKRAAPRRTNWDHDGLLRYVVDSRVVDETTGEIESVLEVVKKVYPLAGYNARLTALRELHIDPDEFAETEWLDRYTLRAF